MLLFGKVPLPLGHYLTNTVTDIIGLTGFNRPRETRTLSASIPQRNSQRFGSLVMQSSGSYGNCNPLTGELQ